MSTIDMVTDSDIECDLEGHAMISRIVDAIIAIAYRVATRWPGYRGRMIARTIMLGGLRVLAAVEQRL